MIRIAFILAVIALATSCASRDDKQAMANVWHMGKALTVGCNRPELIGVELQRLAERHEQQHDYQISKEGK